MYSLILISNLLITAFVYSCGNGRVGTGIETIDHATKEDNEFYACVDSGHPEPTDNVKPWWAYRAIGDSLLEKHRNEKYFSYKRQIANGIYVMEIETFCCNDTIQDIDPPLVASPIIMKQQLVFRKNNVVKKQCKLPVKTVYHTNNHDKKVKGVEIEIYTIYVLKGSNGDIFGITGSGMCMAADCPEFVAFYTMDGNILSHCHSRAKYDIDNGYMSYHEGICRENQVLEKYGIAYDDYNSEGGRGGGVRVDVFKPIPTDE